MFCMHCGKKLEESVAFCPECGTSQIVSPTPTDPPVPIENLTISKPALPTKVIAIGLIGAAVAGLGASYALFDFMKSPTQIFLEAEQKSMMSFYKNYEKDHQTLMDTYVTPYLSAPYKTTSKLSNLNIAIPNLFSSNDSDSLKSGVLESESYMDPTNGNFYSTLALSAKDLEKISLSVFSDDNQMGIRSKFLGDKAITLDLSDNEGLYNYFGSQASEIPKSSISSLELFNAVDLKPEELKAIMMNYGQFFGDHLKDAEITLENGVPLKMNGDSKKVRKLTLAYDQKEFESLMTDLCDKAKDDEQLLDTFYTRYEKVQKILEKSYREPIEFMDKKEFTKQYKEAWDSIAEGVSESEIDSFENSIYITQDDTIVKSEMLLEENDNLMAFTTENWIIGEKSHSLFEMNFDEDNSSEVHLTLSNDSVIKGSTQEGTLKGSLNGASDEKAEFEVEYNHSKNGETTQSTVDFSMNTKNMDSVDYAIEGTLKGDTTFEESKQTNAYHMVLSLTSDSTKMDMDFDLDQTTEENTPFDIAKSIGSGDTINLTKATPEELNLLAQAIQMNFSDYVSRNQKLFGSTY